jgi:GH25 family lysozyme M1 (1,4-beta-N-acetylmuramidase)
MLKGIDISSYQSSINISALETTDFVIVKATQGLSYVNPCYGRHANDTLKAGKLLGVYHYAGGNNAEAEADFFWSRFKPYAGKAIPVLDWEGYQNSRFSQGPAWVIPFVERFHALSGVWPLIYMSKSVCRQHA